jgi:hypothetical protein
MSRRGAAPSHHFDDPITVLQHLFIAFSLQTTFANRFERQFNRRFWSRGRSMQVTIDRVDQLSGYTELSIRSDRTIRYHITLIRGKTTVHRRAPKRL